MSNTYPVFPLPNYFLFPGNAVPLHIFEERYRQMVGDLLDQVGRLVIAPILSHRAGTREGKPPLHSHGCLAEIIRHERLDDGRYIILVAGLARVRIREVAGERLYRRVEAEPIAEIPCSDEEAARLQPLLEKAIHETGGQRLELPRQLSLGVLVDLLLQLLKLSPRRLEEMLAQPDVALRAKAALAWQEEAGM